MKAKRMRAKLKGLILNAAYWVSKLDLRLVLLLIFIPVGMVHNFFRHSSKSADVFLCLDYSLPLPWIMRFSGDMIQFIILSFLWYRQTRKGSLMRDLALAVFIYCLLDTVFFFVSFKIGNYEICYFLLVVVLLCRKWGNGKAAQ